MELEDSDDPLQIKQELENEEQLDPPHVRPQRIRKKVIKVDLTQDCFEEENIDPLGSCSTAPSTASTQSKIATITIKKEHQPGNLKASPRSDDDRPLNILVKKEQEEIDVDIDNSSDEDFKFDDDHFEDQDFIPDEDIEKRKKKSELPFTCKNCGQGFKKKTPHKKHIRRCFPDGLDAEDSSSEDDNSNKTPKVYQCNKCKRKFQVRYYYRRHIAKCSRFKKEESQERPPPVCSFCSETLANDQALRKHIKETHSTEELLWPCPSCPKKFYIERDLVLHKVVHEVKRICELCGKNYSSSKALKRHIETHSDEKHICELCGLALKTSHSLQNHMFSHAEFFRYKCHYCGKGFRRSNSIKLHLMIHQGLKPYKCRFCDKTFTDSAVSRSHMKSSHIELHRKAVERNNGKPIGAIILFRIPTLRELEDKAKAEGTPLQEVGPYRGEEKWQEKMFGSKTNE